MATELERRLARGGDAEPASPRPSPPVLSEEECRGVLARVGWGVLATVGDGQPYGVPVGYALGRDCVYLASGPGRKRRNLEANPRVCLTVCEVATYDRWRSVVVQGEAVPVEGVAARAAAVAAFVAQRAPRARPTDVKRLLGARLLRLPLDAMTGRGRGDAD
jgi:nitroimidazol reductase NimA-like FMN-containing flavoprotein (pyridoxamine 5'-phosphate oxidase superfamily)